ncbi:MAG: hypothetical protein AAFV38_04660 [Pseudomonadota bacterium]
MKNLFIALTFLIVAVLPVRSAPYTINFTFEPGNGSILSGQVMGFLGPTYPDIPTLVIVQSFNSVRVNHLPAPDIVASSGYFPWGPEPGQFRRARGYINITACTDSLELCSDGFSALLDPDDREIFYYWGGPSFDLGLDPNQPLSIWDVDWHAQVPVPASAPLAVTALGGLMFLRNRKSRAHRMNA